MKKLLLLILSLSMATVAFSSCGFLGGSSDSSQENASSSSSVEAPSSEKEEKVYTVTFVQNGKVVKTVEVKEGSAVAEADIPTPTAKVGYTVEWEKVDLSNITANIEVKAVEKANTYTITFDTDGGDAIESQNVTYDDNVTLPEPTREGFTFVAWLDANGNVVSNGKWTIADNVTLKATWNANQVKTYTITFQRADGYVLAAKIVEEGGMLTEADIPAFPADAGYTYAWDIDNFENITSDMTVTLIATANSYTITYNPNDGTLVSGELTQTVVYNEEYTVVAPKLEKEGYTFGGWDGLSALPNGIWTLTNGVTLTAQWNEVIPNTYTISFVIDGQVSTTRTVTEGGTLAEADIPALPANAGYTCAWDVTDFTNITSDMTVTLIKTANTYTITYNPGDEGTITSGASTQTVTYGQDYTLNAPTAVREGYNFIRWEISEGALPVGKWTLPNDVVLNAVWEAKQIYSIAFVQAGQPVKTFNVEKGAAFTEVPATAAKPGYTVTWDENALAQLGNVQENVTVNAVETANTYEITYSDVKGVFTNKAYVTYDSTYDWSNIPGSVAGYHFDKFTLEDGTYVETSGIWTIDYDATIVVHWAGNTYTLVFDANGGSCDETQMTVVYGESYTLPVAAGREGHTFEGWTINGVAVAQTGTWSHTAAGTIELVASWKSDEWTKNY